MWLKEQTNLWRLRVCSDEMSLLPTMSWPCLWTNRWTTVFRETITYVSIPKYGGFRCSLQRPHILGTHFFYADIDIFTGQWPLVAFPVPQFCGPRSGWCSMPLVVHEEVFSNRPKQHTSELLPHCCSTGWLDDIIYIYIYCNPFYIIMFYILFIWR